uniref:coproporphyrinogen oxidase n=1 Tax=Eptatretus burgeri TaxID=7764 RepID=A0A8C4WV35_EPTBU
MLRTMAIGVGRAVQTGALFRRLRTLHPSSARELAQCARAGTPQGPGGGGRAASGAAVLSAVGLGLAVCASRREHAEHPVLLGYDTSTFMAPTVTQIAELRQAVEEQNNSSGESGKLGTGEDRTRVEMELLIMKVQGDVCHELERLDGEGQFLVDCWKREEGGGGITCVMQNGKVFEKAGVNVSVVHGKLPPAAAAQMRSRGHTLKAGPDGLLPFVAMGVSSVIHPLNPHVPTMHFNYRYFEIQQIDGTKDWWFGGGSDLTPCYLYPDDASHFHKTLQSAMKPHSPHLYPHFKKWCDDYFVNTHRGNERRGIGGIFFDDYCPEGESGQTALSLVRSLTNAIIPAYSPIVERRMGITYSDLEWEWQQLRRGRWEYKHEPPAGSREAELLEVLRQPRELIWMDDNRLPKAVLNGELSNGKRDRGAPYKHFNDSPKKYLSIYNINHQLWETQPADRAAW